jgi:hypothetical protein
VSARVTEAERDKLQRLADATGTTLAALLWSPGIKEALRWADRARAAVGPDTN